MVQVVSCGTKCIVRKSKPHLHWNQPPLKDTRRSLHKGKALRSCRDHGNTILPLKDHNLSITVKLAGPKVSVISKFHYHGSVQHIGLKRIFNYYTTLDIQIRKLMQ